MTSVVVGGLVWTALWGELTPGVFLAGAGLTLLIRMGLGSRRRHDVDPIGALVLCQILVRQTIASTLQVARLVLSRQRRQDAILDVALSAHHAGILSRLALAVTFTPGSSVVSVDPVNLRMTVHLLDARDAEVAARQIRVLADAMEKAIRVRSPAGGTP